MQRVIWNVGLRGIRKNCHKGRDLLRRNTNNQVDSCINLGGLNCFSLRFNNTTEKLKFISRVRPNGGIWKAKAFCVECLDWWKQSDVATCMLLPPACCCRALFRVAPYQGQHHDHQMMIIILISSGRCCQLHVLLPRR